MQKKDKLLPNLYFFTHFSRKSRLSIWINICNILVQAIVYKT